jgi:hypothetical protein
VGAFLHTDETERRDTWRSFAQSFNVKADAVVLNDEE